MSIVAMYGCVAARLQNTWVSGTSKIFESAAMGKASGEQKIKKLCVMFFGLVLHEKLFGITNKETTCLGVSVGANTAYNVIFQPSKYF
jgi:hypothetical protein